jgi:hypothetical protein
MINKDLLSEILGFKIENCWVDGNLVEWEKDGMSNINIYELAHKCKDFIFDNHGITIALRYLKRKDKTKYLNDILLLGQNNKGYQKHKIIERLSSNYFFTEISKTDRLESHEIEILICQWIYDRKGSE